MTWGSGGDGSDLAAGTDAPWIAFTDRLAARMGRAHLDVSRGDRLGEVLDDFEVFALELVLRDLRLLATPSSLDLHRSTFADVEYLLSAR